MQKIISSGLAISLLIFLGLLISFFCFSYSDFILFIEKAISLNSQKHQKFIEIIDFETYKRIKFSLLILCFLNLLFLGLIILKSEVINIPQKLLKPIINFPKWIFINFKNLSKTEKTLLFLGFFIILIQRIFLSINTAVIYDEAWTYLAFTSKNPIIAVCFYPTSNNHILYSHFTQLAKYLPFDILFNLRFPSLILGIISVLSFFFFSKQYLREVGFWISFLVFSFSFPTIFYGFAARGYSFILLMFVIGFFSALKLLSNLKNSNAWYSLSLSSVLGFYAIPVYLYPFISINFFLFLYFLQNKCQRGIPILVKHIFLTSISVLLLYLPVFAISGLNSVIGNKFVKSHSLDYVFSNFRTHISNTMQFFTAFEFGSWVFAALLIVVLYVLYKKKKDEVLIFSLFCFAMIPLLIFVHRVIPVERTWIYLMVPLSLLIGKTAELAYLKYILYILFLVNIINVTVNWKKQMLWYDNICEEDYSQGVYFTNYFMNKKALILTSNRMNSYLKFNKELYNQNWEILNEAPEKTKKNRYVILYSTELKNRQTSNLEEIANFKNYHLYLQYEK